MAHVNAKKVSGMFRRHDSASYYCVCVYVRAQLRTGGGETTPQCNGPTRRDGALSILFAPFVRPNWETNAAAAFASVGRGCRVRQAVSVRDA